jgi:hypothetical protein
MNITDLKSVILSLSKDQFFLSCSRQAELILRLRYASLRMTACLVLCLVATESLIAEPSAAVPDNPVQPPIPAPSVDPLTEALPILTRDYPDFQALNYKPGDKLEDLVARSHGGISLVPQDTRIPAPIITSTLPSGAVYWRLASFTPAKGWSDLATELKNDTQQTPGIGAILDLRSNETPQDMRGAEQLMAFFAPGDTTLQRYNLKNLDDTHSLVQANVAPADPFRGPLVVLINQKTSGAAEVLAACLKADGALVVGASTAGKGAAFSELKLSCGETLGYVTDHVYLADGTDLWGHAVVPDISPTVNEQSERGALILIGHHNVLDVIGESPDRHLMSEAALIQGVDPEWDAYLASLEKKPVLLSLPIIHDEALISALDSLKAIQVSQRHVEPATTIETAPPTSTAIR